jgi:hypothetical protein
MFKNMVADHGIEGTIGELKACNVHPDHAASRVQVYGKTLELARQSLRQ